MFIQVFRKNTKRKVKSFNKVHRIVSKDCSLVIYPLTGISESFDLSMFDFYILD